MIITKAVLRKAVAAKFQRVGFGARRCLCRSHTEPLDRALAIGYGPAGIRTLPLESVSINPN